MSNYHHGRPAEKGHSSGEFPLACSFFKHALSPEARNWSGSWEALIRILERTFTPKSSFHQRDPKLGLPAISAATYDPPRRGHANAQGLQLLALDIDNSLLASAPPAPSSGGRPPRLQKSCLPNPVLMTESQSILEAKGIAGYGWTTWSDQPNWPRHRVIIPLLDPIPAQHWHNSITWAMEHLGLAQILRGLDLPATRDTARIFFLPGHPTDPGLIRRFCVPGELLRIPWKSLIQLEAQPSSQVLHPPHSAAKPSGERHWAASLPVNLATLRLADLLREIGLQVGVPRPYQGGTRWRTHCPWFHEHTHQLDDDAGVVIHLPGHWPTWKCAHASHQHLGLKDILRLAGALK